MRLLTKNPLSPLMVALFSILLGMAPLSHASAETRTFKLDPAHLHIAFMVEHIGFAKTLGVFTKANGTILFDEEAPALDGLDVSIETASVHTGHKARDGHIKGKDFLDAAAYPTMTFTLTDARQETEKTGTITGDLTMRGVTKPVTLDVTWNKSGAYPFGDKHYVVGVSARGTLNRSDWGMTYGVGGNIVGDQVTLIIEAELIRQPE